MDVTCLVPAYKPRYFEHLLYALKRQSLAPIRILISDDSPDNAFITAFTGQGLLERYGSLPIEVIEGPKQGHHRNIEHLLDRFVQRRSSHFHICHDDDIIYPEFYEAHARAVARHDPLCSVSNRWVADSRGIQIGHPRLPTRIRNDDRLLIPVTAEYLFSSCIARSRSWLGELPCAVFRSDFIDRPEYFCVQNDLAYHGLNDIGSFFKASLRGKLVYSRQYLGAFRRVSDSLSGLRGYSLGLSILANLPLNFIAHEQDLASYDDLRATIRQVREMFSHVYGETVIDGRLAQLSQQAANGDYVRLKESLQRLWRWYTVDVPDLKRLRSRDELSAGLRLLADTGADAAS